MPGKRPGHAPTLPAVVRHRREVNRAHRVRNPDQLVKMIDACGFAYGFTLRTGDAAIPACFDHLSTSDDAQRWNWMWVWKDELPEAKRLYYGALLVRKPTFVSNAFLPTFYATFGRAGEADDHLEDVRAGRLSDTGRRIIEYLGATGETQTKRMRAELGITSKEGKLQYGKAIDEVQRLMYVARVRAVGEGREDYNYTYDLFMRRYPEIVKSAERISSSDATLSLLERTVELAGAASRKQVARLFEWDEALQERATQRAIDRGTIALRDGELVLASLLR